MSGKMSMVLYMVVLSDLTGEKGCFMEAEKRYFFGYGWLSYMPWETYLEREGTQYEGTEVDYKTDTWFDIIRDIDGEFYYTIEGGLENA